MKIAPTGPTVEIDGLTFRAVDTWRFSGLYWLTRCDGCGGTAEVTVLNLADLGRELVISHLCDQCKPKEEPPSLADHLADYMRDHGYQFIEGEDEDV